MEYFVESEIMKRKTVEEYEKNINLLEKFIEKSEIKKINLDFFLIELNRRFKKLIKELTEDEKIGYYELVRSTYEFGLIILFILKDKKNVINKILCYDYVLNYEIIRQIRDALNNNILTQEMNEYFSGDKAQVDVIKKEYKKRVNYIKKQLKDKKYKEVVIEFKKSCNKTRFPKFYYCYCNKEIQSIAGLAKYLNKSQSYETLYSVTSAISHGENLFLREDFNLIITTTFEFNFIVCEIVRKLGLYYCNIIESHNLEEQIKYKLGKNYPKFFERLKMQ